MAINKGKLFQGFICLLYLVLVTCGVLDTSGDEQFRQTFGNQALQDQLDGRALAVVIGIPVFFCMINGFVYAFKKEERPW